MSFVRVSGSLMLIFGDKVLELSADYLSFFNRICLFLPAAISTSAWLLSNLACTTPWD
jgi:hypothetical protein